MNKITTDIQIKKLTKPGNYSLGNGVYLAAAKAGSKSFKFRYKYNGQDRWLGLGGYPTITLKDALQAGLGYRAKFRALQRDGIDPQQQAEADKQKAQSDLAKLKTFGEWSEIWRDKKRKGWTGKFTESEIVGRLNKYVLPLIGNRYPDTLTVTDIIDLLAPIWEKKPSTANSVRGNIEGILALAAVHAGTTHLQNPAVYKHNLEFAFDSKSQIAPTVHRASVDYHDLPGIYAKIRADETMQAKVLAFLISTGTRDAMTREAQWSEFDFDNGVWIIPSERMKSRVKFAVPITQEMIEILDEAKAIYFDGINCFPGYRRGRPVSNNSIRRYTPKMTDGKTTHGFRSTFKTWCDDVTDIPDNLSEKMLAHKIKDKAKASYARSDMGIKHKNALELWQRYCRGELAEKPSNVVEFKAVG